jgi:DNA-binding PadR family transcriptional regulator
MASQESSAASYVILGLLDTYGFETVYEMKQFIEVSIGFFWPFPHSQLYGETRRLEQAGLIAAEVEQGGRRRKMLHITDAGRDALREWQAEPVDVTTEIRDLGLLKLFLTSADDQGALRALAERQVELHEHMLDVYRGLAAGYAPPRAPGEKTIELGVAYEHAAVEFWRSVADEYGADRPA